MPLEHHAFWKTCAERCHLSRGGSIPTIRRWWQRMRFQSNPDTCRLLGQMKLVRRKSPIRKIFQLVNVWNKFEYIYGFVLWCLERMKTYEPLEWFIAAFLEGLICWSPCLDWVSLPIWRTSMRPVDSEAPICFKKSLMLKCSPMFFFLVVKWYRCVSQTSQIIVLNQGPVAQCSAKVAWLKMTQESILARIFFTRILFILGIVVLTLVGI